MATFNIYGCCICRDLFGFIDYNEHEVIHFLQSSSQITNFVYTTKPKKELSMEDFKDVSINNFKKTCIIHDYNKTLTGYYTEPADFFIVDLVNIANTHLKKETYADGSEHYFTSSLWFKLACENGLDKYFSESKLESVNVFDVLDKIGTDIVLERLIKWLKEDLHYKEEQIILIENGRTPLYTHKNKLYCFEKGTRDKVNGLLDRLYTSFKEKCPSCHVVKMPYVTYADSANKWDLSDQHYSIEFYEYLYECVHTIAQNPGNCEEKLFQIRDKYSKYFYKKISEFIFNSQNAPNLLKGDFTSAPNKYIAEKNSKLYSSDFEELPNAVLQQYETVTHFDFPYAQLADGYVHSDHCVKGIIGDQKKMNPYWTAVNNSTCVIFRDHSIVLTHAGNLSKAQMNIIQTVEDFKDLAKTTVTFSVWARVLKASNNRGGWRNNSLYQCAVIQFW